MERYSVIFDDGNPYESSFEGLYNLQSSLKRFYEQNEDSDYQFDVLVMDSKGEDITESQMITEIISGILGENDLREKPDIERQERLAKELVNLSDNKEFFAKAGYKWDGGNEIVWTGVEEEFYDGLPLSMDYGDWVQPRFKEWLDKNKLSFEFYDSGTLMIYDDF